MNFKTIGKSAIALFASLLLFSCSGEGSSNSTSKEQNDSETVEFGDIGDVNAEDNRAINGEEVTGNGEDINIGNID